MSSSFSAVVQSQGHIPLGWAGSTTDMNYLNFGDALSPVIVALVSGKTIERVPSKSGVTRLAAVGTIGHGFENGEVHFWGTGCSGWKNPGASAESRLKYTPPEDSRFIIHATRGPVSERLLSGGTKINGVYGDPVWLLPRFYRPRIKKKWALGVILHLSELADRATEAHPFARYQRYEIPPSLADNVHLITTVTPIDVGALQDKVDEILACERIVSTSLHGMVIAESYGIPCLYFSPNPAQCGLNEVDLSADGPTDLRIVDLYQGLQKKSLPGYFQEREKPTDWEDLIRSIDSAWEPTDFDGERLIEAFPLKADPIVAPPGGTIWQNDIVAGLTLQHDVVALRRADRIAARGEPEKKAVDSAGKPPKAPAGSGQHVLPATLKAPAQPVRSPVLPLGDEAASERTGTLLRMNAETLSVPLSWVATTAQHPHANLGDALSAFIVAGMAGVPVRHANFDNAGERMVAVGTIGHNQRNGILHFWGTGVDPKRNSVDSATASYLRPPNTEFRVTALRGPQSARTMRAAGIDVPDVYGDPVWLLPHFWPVRDTTKTWEIGVVLHISELEAASPEAGPKSLLKRYGIPEEFEGRVRLINTYCAPTVAAMRAKVEEIASCKAIVSTSLHGLVIAETYGIPCAWFAPFGDGEGRQLDLHSEKVSIDHRMRDFYLGAGRDTLSTFCLDRHREARWDDVMGWVHEEWAPLTIDEKPLIEAFPLPLAISSGASLWDVPERVTSKIKF